MSAQNPTPCEFLPWDTDFFGCRIARVCGDTLNDTKASTIDAWAIDNSIRALYFLARSDDPITMRMAERHGYSLADIRMTFERTLQPDEPHLVKSASNMTLRPARAEDLPALREMAKTGHDQTRFANDTHFPRARVEAFYAKWIQLECQGRAQNVLVAASEKDEPLGYISCHLRHRASGEIGLVGVHAEARGNGLGSVLVLGALRWFAGKEVAGVTVVTQGNNKAAQRLYQRCGFLTREVQVWYHKWFPETP